MPGSRRQAPAEPRHCGLVTGPGVAPAAAELSPRAAGPVGDDRQDSDLQLPA
jgi:hypothetical protein